MQDFPRKLSKFFLGNSGNLAPGHMFPEQIVSLRLGDPRPIGHIVGAEMLPRYFLMISL